MKRALFVVVFITAIVMGVAVATALTTDPQYPIKVYDCQDAVDCRAECQLITAPANTCYVMQGPTKNHSIYSCGSWCDDVRVGPCFHLMAYRAGSQCSGPKLKKRSNFCDECKGAGDTEWEHLQRRQCSFDAAGNIASVSYTNCTAQNRDGFCTGCDASPQDTYPFMQCVTTGGFDWRLEMVKGDCKLMRHGCWYDKTCRAPGWVDRIVLDECNDGWMFHCPSYAGTRKPGHP